MKLVVGYPDRDAELTMLDLPSVSESARPDFDAGPARQPRRSTVPMTSSNSALWPPRSAIAPAVKEYIVDLVRATREPAAYGLSLGAVTGARRQPARHDRTGAGRPRATPCCAAATSSRPTTSRVLARDVMRHRILVSFEADAEGLTPDDILQRILDHIPVP